MLGARLGGAILAVASTASILTMAAQPVAAYLNPAFRNGAQMSDWRQYRGDADHRGWNQSETILSPTNVGDLQILWRAYGGFNSSPAVAHGIVYDGDANLGAFSVDCATDGSYCSPLWYGGTGYPDWDSPAVAGGMVYMQSTQGLFAFKVGCASDGSKCAPVWTDPTIGNTGYTSPAVANGWLYSATGNGDLRGYDLARCAAQGGECHADWIVPLGFMSYSSPAVSKGVVYVGGRDGYLYAFPARCSTGGGTCSAIWKGPIGPGTNSSPAVANGEVYMPSLDGHMYVFAVGCGKNGAICQPKWTAQLDDVYINGSPAVTNDMVYVPGTRRLFAFPVNCRSDGGLCSPTWMSRKTGVGGSFAASPAVANGVVYIPTQGRYQGNGRLLAFNAYCTNANHVCKPIWRSDYLGAMTNSSPAVAHGMVFVASNSGMFYAFGLPPTQ